MNDKDFMIIHQKIVKVITDYPFCQTFNHIGRYLAEKAITSQ